MPNRAIRPYFFSSSLSSINVRRRFFFAANCVLLAAVLFGFGRTFYLRAFFTAGSLPVFLYVHGTILTLWFSLVTIQAWLVISGQVRWHRRVGCVVASYAAAVVISGLYVNSHLASTLTSPTDVLNIIVWGNYGSLLLFAVFVGLGVLLRKRPEVHVRLMLYASVSIMGPALARFAGDAEALRRNFAIGGLLVLLVSLFIYDIIVRRRPHPATWLGAVSIIASLTMSVALAVTGIGFRILQYLFHAA